MLKNKISFIVLLLLSVILVFSGLTVIKAEAQDEQVDVLRLSGGDSGFPSPFAHGRRGGGIRRTFIMYDGLLEKDEEGLIPWIAEDYKIKDNGKQYLFTIREGIKWHDGKPLTAEDVKFTFEYTAKHPMVRQWVSPEDIEEIEIIEGRKVLITVAQPKVTNLYNLGMTYIIPEHVWEGVENPKEYLSDDALIGSGPYKILEYNRTHGTYRYEAFSKFWGPTPAFKIIEAVPVSEEVMAIERGEIDIMRHVSADLLPRYEDKPEFGIKTGRCFAGSRLLLNMKDYPIFRQKKLRQAIMYAIDSKELIDKVARSSGVPKSAGILPPDHIMYNPDIKEYGYKPEKAKEILNQIGYGHLNKDGFWEDENGKEISFDLLCSSRSNTSRSGELIKEQLARVGIKIDVKIVDRSKGDDMALNNQYQINLYGHAGLGNNADYLRERYGNVSSRSITTSMGSPGYKNEKLAELLEKQQLEFNKEKRKKLLFEIQEILAEEVPEITLYFSVEHDVYRSDKYDGWVTTFDSRCPLNAIFSYLLKD